MRILIALLVMLAACSGDEVDTVCTKAAYDPCNSEHDCTTSLCQNFESDGFQVCSQGCDADNPCPAGGTCNAMSLCKPAEPNDCAIVE